jgi:hypothetical protein
MCEGEDTSEDIGTDGRPILKWFLNRMEGRGMCQIHLAKQKDQ